MLERYGHGGDWLTARELYGKQGNEGDFIDFSANMNPFGPPACVGELLRRYESFISRYPDPAVRGLRGKLAERHGVPADCLLVGNGAAELIDLLFRELRPKATVLAEPCFIEYREAAAKIGSAVHAVGLKAELDFRLTMDAALDKLKQLRENGLKSGETLWFLGSPNNPTGQTVERTIVEELLRQGETVAMDEAFMDFAADESGLSLLGEAASREKLIVLRSMTKFYAIPGIRLGYMAAEPSLIRRLSELQVPWSVNSLAQLIGEAVLDDAEYAEQTVAWLRTERAWMTEKLQALGLFVFGSAAVNHILFALPEHFGWTSERLQAALGPKGLLIRDASRFIGLDNRYVRIAVRLRPDNEALLEQLRELFEGRGERG
ncbi:pyridoxal phosphate-dependent class II aminotransferase [Paenibacillus rhizovicinus]|uniref:Aminotransferase n=1 Tax=Paenibacillus rhizovicinus TaxID=2704463 RepID=A0A6C0NUV8_9BACL|nr:threonine-phosphate decarboxylase [Paenibacillus rhizovicinus]QHW29977.1 pyridoxal phosphate-dependent class II aminotransferase [Paenibacillus rhizovicinus]